MVCIGVIGISYIFLDSEGLGSAQQNSDFDTKLMSLAVLLSSLFVLNTQVVIDIALAERPNAYLM